MIYVCPEKDCAVQKPCEPCICGMDTLPAFRVVREAAVDAAAAERALGEPGERISLDTLKAKLEN